MLEDGPIPNSVSIIIQNTGTVEVDAHFGLAVPVPIAIHRLQPSRIAVRVPADRAKSRALLASKSALTIWTPVNRADESPTAKLDSGWNVPFPSSGLLSDRWIRDHRECDVSIADRYIRGVDIAAPAYLRC